VSAKILVVDDEATFRERFVRSLERKGYDAQGVGSRRAALDAISDDDFDVAFLDIRLPDGSGLELFEDLNERSPQTAIVMITAYAGLDSAVEALRQGAVDYLSKPFVFDNAHHRLARLLEYRDMLAENQLLRRELSGWRGEEELIGKSSAFNEVRRFIERVAPVPSTVLITGESGTGKELVARAIHRNSASSDGRFVAVNCAAIPGELLESELFGHEKGAFTGAGAQKRGLFELAHGGTLFLDEIAELALPLQAKLLRVLEGNEIVRVGGTRTIPLELRVLVATNRKLEEEIARDRFRQDLYYRIGVLEVELPPLRSRRDDIPLLARHFVDRYRRELKRHSRGVGNNAMRYLMTYDWPGNVRELENVVERAMILGSGDWIEPGDLPDDITGAHREFGDNLRQALVAYEREHVRSVLGQADGDRGEAARRLGVGVSTLYRKLQELGLDTKANDDTDVASAP